MGKRPSLVHIVDTTLRMNKTILLPKMILKNQDQKRVIVEDVGEKITRDTNLDAWILGILLKMAIGPPFRMAKIDQTTQENKTNDQEEIIVLDNGIPTNQQEAAMEINKETTEDMVTVKKKIKLKKYIILLPIILMNWVFLVQKMLVFEEQM